MMHHALFSAWIDNFDHVLKPFYWEVVRVWIGLALVPLNSAADMCKIVLFTIQARNFV